jgi:hypothetical protein
LVYRFLKDHAGQLVDRDGGGETPEQFFLKHVDDKGDHLLVDKDLNITGIIDWQMARVVPRLACLRSAAAGCHSASTMSYWPRHWGRGGSPSWRVTWRTRR